MLLAKKKKINKPEGWRAKEWETYQIGASCELTPGHGDKMTSSTSTANFQYMDPKRSATSMFGSGKTSIGGTQN